MIKHVTQFNLDSIGEFLAQYAEYSNDVYWLSSPDFQRIVYISPAYEKIWGRTIVDLYANPQSWNDALSNAPDHYNPIAAMAERIADEGPTARYNELYQIKRPDGEIRWILDRGFPIYDLQGACCGVTGVATDITESKQAEEALKLAKECETETRRALIILSGSMAHDLRNPLIITRMISNSMNKHFAKLVNGYKKAQTAGLVDADELTNFQLNYLANAPDKLLESIEQMNTFIDDDLKTISHVVSGSKSREDLIECRINICITKAISHYPFEENEKELLYWQSNNDFIFMGNPVLFYRLIFNLLKNALHQIKKRCKGKIYISTELKDDVNILRFKDTAGGMTNEIISRLFECFNTTKKEGTGIGLAFCKFTMRSFGGDIIARCADGDCIEFELTFPKI